MSKCETCRFLEVTKTHWREGNQETERPAEQWERRCRRFPPIMVKHKSSCAEWLDTGWPEVRGTDWCGEHQEGQS